MADITEASRKRRERNARRAELRRESRIKALAAAVSGGDDVDAAAELTDIALGLVQAGYLALGELAQDGPAWGPLRAALIRAGVRGI